MTSVNFTIPLEKEKQNTQIENWILRRCSVGWVEIEKTNLKSKKSHPRSLPKMVKLTLNGQ